MVPDFYGSDEFPNGSTSLDLVRSSVIRKIPTSSSHCGKLCETKLGCRRGELLASYQVDKRTSPLVHSAFNLICRMMPIAGKKPANETAAKKPAKPQRESA